MLEGVRAEVPHSTVTYSESWGVAPRDEWGSAWGWLRVPGLWHTASVLIFWGLGLSPVPLLRPAKFYSSLHSVSLLGRLSLFIVTD